MTLPHMRVDRDKEPEVPFTTVNAEIARLFQQTHPDYGKPDEYGNMALEHPDANKEEK